MKNRLLDAVKNSTEIRALIVLIVLLILRAWRAIPHLRPTQLLVPASLMQMLVFITAAINEENFILNLAIGNFIVVGLALLPMTFAKPNKSADPVHIEK